MKSQGPNIQDLSLLELFQLEAGQQVSVLVDGLLALERHDASQEQISTMMRAAHSLKGAARLVGCGEIVELAHAMEDQLTKRGTTVELWHRDIIDMMLEVVDTIDEIAREKQENKPISNESIAQTQYMLRLLRSESSTSEVAQADSAEQAALKEWERRRGDRRQEPRHGDDPAGPGERTVRVSVERFDALVSFVGDVLRNTRWLRPFTTSLRRLNRQQTDLLFDFETLGEKLRQSGVPEEVSALWADINQRLGGERDGLRGKLAELEVFDVKLEAAMSRLNAEVMASRLRPFRDGVRGLPRIIRTIGRELGKDVRLEILGLDTQIDRELLQRIEAPLSHLLNNAVDHGIETEEERELLGKPRAGRIVIHAYPQRGSILIKVSDDGQGIDREKLITKIVQLKLLDINTARTLSDNELFEFILMPGFSTRDVVSELSGRGVGLDVVVEMLREMNGSLEIKSQSGLGTEFILRMPLTRAVLNALLLEIGGEPYAVPLGRVERIIRVGLEAIAPDEQGRMFLHHQGASLPVLPAARILELDRAAEKRNLVSAFVVRDLDHEVAVVVDRLISEKELVIRPLPEYIGKIRDISGVSLLDNDEPVLILDVDEFLQSSRLWLAQAAPEKHDQTPLEVTAPHLRVLVVDDSITVRELQRQLLTADGYEVSVAVDGMAGWQMLKAETFDLLITDVDMPRLDGIQLVHMVRSADELKHLPILVMSYMDRAQDADRAYAAGANMFIPKADFQEPILRREVRRLLLASAM